MPYNGLYLIIHDRLTARGVKFCSLILKFFVLSAGFIDCTAVLLQRREVKKMILLIDTVW